jgi:FMN phosphatase YigB (HAD superfamily)
MELTIRSDTFLKSRPVDSTQLGPEEKVNLEEGASIEVHSAMLARSGHLEVRLKEPLNGQHTWFGFREHLDLDGVDYIDTVFFDIGDTLHHDRVWADGAQSLLNTLRETGYNLGIISNTPRNADRPNLLARYPPGFDFADFHPSLIFLSHEVGFRKPFPEIFLAAVRAHGNPGRCLFLTESAEHTLAAQRAGMMALRLDSANPSGRSANLTSVLKNMEGSYP